jgi:hypothetical protein
MAVANGDGRRRIRVHVEDVQTLIEVIDERANGRGTGHGRRLAAHEADALERLRAAVVYRLHMTWLR